MSSTARGSIGSLVACTAVVSAAAGAALASAVMTHRQRRQRGPLSSRGHAGDDQQSEGPGDDTAQKIPMETSLMAQESDQNPPCCVGESSDSGRLPAQSPQHEHVAMDARTSIDGVTCRTRRPSYVGTLNDEPTSAQNPPDLTAPPATSLSRSGSENSHRPRVVRRSSLRNIGESSGGDGADGSRVGGRRQMARRVSFSNAASALPNICTTDFVSGLDAQLSQRRRRGIKDRSGSFDSSVASSFSSHGDETDEDGGGGGAQSTQVSSPPLPFPSSSESRRESTTTVEIGEDEGGFNEDDAVRDLEEFESTVVSKITDLKESLTLLRRTRTVAKISHRLMAAPDETACFEEVTKLFVPLFGVDRCSYALLVDANHFTIRKVTVHRRDHATKLGIDFEQSNSRIPLEDSAVGHCAKTLEPLYTPRTKESKFKLHKKIHAMGLNTVLTTPILVNGNKFAGCLNMGLVEEDALTKHDQLLVKDIAAILGASIYAKRMQRAIEASNRVSQELLHSFIPPKVLEKIECYWDVESEEYQSLGRRSSRGSLASSRHSSMSSFDVENGDDDNDTDIDGKISRRARWHEVKGQLSFVNGIEAVGDDNIGVTIDTSAIDFDRGGVTQALYAEDFEQVCIVFTDIVGFSKIALDLAPIEVMDMIQALFSRFDELCDFYGVLKLETIGDAYLCSTGLMEEEDNKNSDGGKDAAIRALDMARDMVLAAQEVRVPRSKTGETLQIRVGIHIGPITAGVLGHRMPKFSCFGSAVNMAARMEQTSLPSKIRVTKDFHDLVGDYETGWEGREMIEVKNMGEVVTYLLNPAE